MASVSFKLDDTHQDCGGIIYHVYECKCDDYWGYCKNTDCSWYECKTCHEVVPSPPRRQDTRMERTDQGTEKERNALEKIFRSAGFLGSESSD